MLSKVNVVEYARTWIGVKWVHQGRTILGLDCAGLIVVVGNDLDILNYDTRNYQRRTHGHDFIDHFRTAMDEIPVLEASPGDVVLFRDNAFPCHSAIVAQGRYGLNIIHAHATRRQVLEESMDTTEWMRKRVGAFAYRGVE